ncbi:MAG: hypothetical protein ABR572_09170 [Cryomorphaceae bacterium]|nr:hypothetical protein [Flavobacteriales bacterium]
MNKVNAVATLFNILVALVFLLCSSFYCFGQSEFLQTVNIDSKELIPFVSVNMDGGHYFSDDQGRFPKNDVVGDSVLVSRLGFKSLKLSVSEIGDTIFMTPNVIELPAFSVSATNDPFELGFHDSNPERISAQVSPGFFVGVKIDSELYPLVVEEVIINFRKIKKGVVFDVYIFDAISDTKAGDVLQTVRYKTQNSRKIQRISTGNSEVVLGSNGGFICIVIPDLGAAEKSDDSMIPSVRITEENDALKSFVFYKNQWSIRNPCYKDDQSCPAQNLMIGAKVRHSK